MGQLSRGDQQSVHRLTYNVCSTESVFFPNPAPVFSVKGITVVVRCGRRVIRAALCNAAARVNVTRLHASIAA